MAYRIVSQGENSMILIQRENDFVAVFCFASFLFLFGLLFSFFVSYKSLNFCET